jgi:hypothetical protein
MIAAFHGPDCTGGLAGIDCSGTHRGKAGPERGWVALSLCRPTLWLLFDDYLRLASVALHDQSLRTLDVSPAWFRMTLIRG